MSEHLVTSSVAAPKRACVTCGRNVRIAVIDGTPIALDTELIAVVPYRRVETVDGVPVQRRLERVQRVLAHRVHAELCEKYKLEAERERWREERKAAERPAKIAARKAARKAARAARELAPAPITDGR